MQLACPSCETLYDVSDYPPGYAFTCTCGRPLTVPHAAPASGSAGGSGPFLATSAGGAATPSADPGLEGWVKVLVFGLNLCFTPLVGLVWWLIVRKEKPKTAGELCTLTWIPVVLWAVVVVVAMLASLLAGS